MIEVQGLAKNYGEKTALLPVSVTIPKGKTLSVVGLSGCGKTTFLRCVAGLIPDYEGTIRLAGMTHQEYLRKMRVAMIFQKYSNFQWLTVQENLLEAFASTGKSDAAEIECKEMLAALGLSDWQSAYIPELSGGMEQRIALGRALLQSQDIIGLDEPFAALDVKNRRAMQDLVKKIFQEDERTAIFVTHDLAEAIYVGDLILVLPSSASDNPKLYDSVESSTVDQEVKSRREFVDLQNEITQTISQMPQLPSRF